MPFQLLNLAADPRAIQDQIKVLESANALKKAQEALAAKKAEHAKLLHQVADMEYK